MTITWIALGVLAIALAWPVPILLARAEWPTRAPGTALVVWQSIALTGGLSMIGALLAFGLQPFGSSLVGGIHSLFRSLAAGTLPPGAQFAQMFALSGAILLTLHLLANLALTTVRSERSRRRHEQLLALLSAPIPDRPGTRLIEHEAPVAYCLPGGTTSITVLTAGLVSMLDEEQLRAVIAHERAHVSQRHHLVLLAFRAWRGSLPWFPIATRAYVAVAMLVEMVADDRARRVVSDSTLTQSIAIVGAGQPQVDGPVLVGSAAGRWLTAHAPSATQRIERLASGTVPLATAGRGLAVGLAIALIAIPTVLLLTPLT